MADLALRATAIRRGVRLEGFAVAWMAVEALLAIGAGVAARSVPLTAFGSDSLIELLSGATLLWRLEWKLPAGTTLASTRWSGEPFGSRLRSRWSYVG